MARMRSGARMVRKRSRERGHLGNPRGMNPALRAMLEKQLEAQGRPVSKDDMPKNRRQRRERMGRTRRGTL